MTVLSVLLVLGYFLIGGGVVFSAQKHKAAGASPLLAGLTWPVLALLVFGMAIYELGRKLR